MLLCVGLLLLLECDLTHQSQEGPTALSDAVTGNSVCTVSSCGNTFEQAKFNSKNFQKKSPIVINRRVPREMLVLPSAVKHLEKIKKL